MERDKVIELMRSVSIPAGSMACEWFELVNGVPTQLALLVDLVEKETLERAAKVCEDAKATVWNYHSEEIKSTAFNTCDNLAYSIRGLKDNP